MSTKDKTKKNVSEQQIDEIVAAQANDDAAWGKPVRVRRTKPSVRPTGGNRKRNNHGRPRGTAQADFN
jgi:hypothetical protein